MRLSEILERFNHAYHLRAEGFTFEDLFEEHLNIEELADLYLIADEYRKTINTVASQIAETLEPRLGNKALDLEGTLIWRGESKRERCIDEDGFYSWLSKQDDPNLVRKVFNPNSARKGAIPPAARDTFFEKQSTGKVEVQYAPVEVIEDAKQKKALRDV